MFVARAHSFEQQARLAITLAWVAGCTNVITLVKCGAVTSHVTGNVSNLGHAAVEGHWFVASYLLFLLLMFGLGAAISSLLTETGRRHGWDSIFVLPMAFEAFFLAVIAIGIEFWDPTTTPTTATTWVITAVASMSMGLQNATITRISSGVVRTTHLTGVLTDLGSELVLFLFSLRDRFRDSPPGDARSIVRGLTGHASLKRLLMLASIIGSFLLGAAIGTLALDHIPRWCMFPPVAFLLWIIFQDVRTPICDIEGSDLGDDDLGIQLPEAIAVFHLRKGKGKADLAHRLPDLERWCERLPLSKRVVILDLGAAELDADAASELRQLIVQSKARDRVIILSGISGAQYNQLRREGAGDALDPSNVCPDIELAIARGLSILEHLPPR
jgi:uncharacterized membrane protein YoaK (UPF0700 family)